MSGVPYDLSCPKCGAEHPQSDVVEEAILNGMQADEIQWVCQECGEVARIDRDVEEL